MTKSSQSETNTPFTSIARKFWNKGPSSLSERPETSGDQFERRGLAWLTALARVELGALAAGFTEHPDPFTLAPPNARDVRQYAEVLLDSLRTHYWALRNDPIAMKMRTASIN